MPRNVRMGVVVLSIVIVLSPARAESPTARAHTALTSAKAQDAKAIPILIDLLAELDAEERASVEEFLTRLAGAEAPPLRGSSTDDTISRRIRRDAWKSWWRRIDGAALLAAVRKHTPTADKRRKVRQWIAQLGDEDFKIREKASKALFAVGRVALPQLCAALKNRDAEISRRAKLLIERIERQPAYPQLASAVRLLALRQPAGTVAALLAFLPHAEEENLADEVQTSLAALARRDDQAKSALRRALDDSRRPPHVRMHVALTLASAGEREAVAVLIDLLAVLPDETASRVEEALFQLAGDSAPKMLRGPETVERGKCRNAWAAWWKVNAERADLTRLREPPPLGFTLICANRENRVFEIDRRGKQRWTIDNLTNPLDAVVLPGNRVLIAELHANRVSERDFKGNILWQTQVDMPTCVQRLANGNTFIATYRAKILEVDRAGKVIYAIRNVPKDVESAFRFRKGSIAYLTQQGECVLMDPAGKRLKSFDTHHAFTRANPDWIEKSANGGILIAQPERNKVIEYTVEGKKVREVDAPQVTTATTLSNGHILVADWQGQRVYEMNRAGKIVWEHKNAGHAFLTRRR